VRDMNRNDNLGFTQEGLNAALHVKKSYREHQPICVMDDQTKMLIPEHLLNNDLDLRDFEDPLPLAMMATRDPESPMALAAVTRLSKWGKRNQLVAGVFDMVGQTTKHALVKKCVEMVSDNAFAPNAIAQVHLHAMNFVVKTRKQYTVALKRNLKALLDGNIAPRQFVDDFFTLTEAGNLRHDIRKKLLQSLLLSDNIRPSIKFLILENFDRMPDAVKSAIASSVLKANANHHTVLIKEELKWIIAQSRSDLLVN
jgi:hypothetical protein